MQRDALGQAMRAGHSFVLFAEGTSTDGLGVLPFKTSLLSVAERGVVDRPIAVQAVTLAYTSWRDGTPIDRSNRDLYAWYGDATLLPHLWRVLQAPGVTIEVGLSSPELSWAVRCRRRLGQELHATISRQLLALRHVAISEGLVVTDAPTSFRRYREAGHARPSQNS